MLLVYSLTFRAPSQILLIDALLRLLEFEANTALSISSVIGGVNFLSSCSLMISFLIESARSGVAREILAILALSLIHI